MKEGSFFVVEFTKRRVRVSSLFAHCCRQVVYLEEGDMCVVRRAPSGEVTYTVQPFKRDEDGVSAPKTMEVHHIELSLDAIEKGGYKHCTCPHRRCPCVAISSAML